MIAIEIEMPQVCGECQMNTYYPFTGQTRCRVTGEVLADNNTTIEFEGRSQACPPIDLSDDGK